jgi:hypothetical protein
MVINQKVIRITVHITNHKNKKIFFSIFFSADHFCQSSLIHLKILLRGLRAFLPIMNSLYFQETLVYTKLYTGHT